MIGIILWFVFGAIGTFLMCKTCDIEIYTWEDLLKFLILTCLGFITFLVVIGTIIVTVIIGHIKKPLPWKK